MDKIENFYATLDSHERRFRNPHANNSDFKISITNGITLSNKSRWEVGLVDGCLPNKTHNINADNSVFYFVIRNPRYSTYVDGALKYKVVHYGVGEHDDYPMIRVYDYRQVLMWAYAADVTFRNSLLWGLLETNIRGPSSDGTLEEDENTALADQVHSHFWDNEISAIPFDVQRGVYDNYKNVTTIIQNEWQKVLAPKLAELQNNLVDAHEWTGGVTMAWDYHFKRLRLISNNRDNIGLAIPTNLGAMLGIDPNTPTAPIHQKPFYCVFPSNRNAFIRKPDMYLGLTNLYVYTDIIDFGIVGSGQSQLLRHFSYNQDGGPAGMTELDIKHVHYLPITDRRINDIYIFIRNELGNPIQFVGGDCVIRLAFRKRQLL